MTRATAFALGALAVSAALASCAQTVTQDVAAASSHPLEPLSEAEITAAATAVRADARCPPDPRFPIVTLHEPSKEQLASFLGGAPVPREALIVLLDKPSGRTYEAVINVGKRSVTSWRDLPGVQPAMLIDEYIDVPGLVRADPRWQRALARRGVREPEKVQIDTWAPGHARVAGVAGVRLACCIAYDRRNQVNGYARPVEGLYAIVDLTHNRVLEVRDEQKVTIPETPSDLDAASIGKLRSAPRPLAIVQPEGPTFEVDGHSVRWQGWRFRFSLHPREGLVLHQVAYDDGGRQRFILHHAGLSEMVVPYGDPDAAWSWRSAFDVGEYGVGRLSSQLVPGIDVPENAKFFDAVFANDLGEPYTQERSAALYERDGGMLWRHWDFEKNHTEARRGRELVLSYVATVGNYDYALSWTFRQDGTLSASVDLTGILLPKGVDSATCASCASGQVPETDRYGTLVAKHIVAVNHQHFFCFRLDFDVDGPRNVVSELDVLSATAAGHTTGNAFVVEERRIASERESGRDLNLATARKWKVCNASARNALGHRIGYMLVPGENSVPYNRADSPIRRRSRFTEHHVWVTRYHPDEIYAAGAYPNQQESDSGLPVWTADGEPLDGEDVVVWYTMGITHTPRAEEWPVMPVHHAGFTLMPHGFFTRNPALDVPER